MVFPLPSAAWATAQDRVPIINRPTEEHTDTSAEPMPGKLQRLVERPLHHSEFLMPFSCLIGNSIFCVIFGRHIIISFLLGLLSSFYCYIRIIVSIKDH
jgi:uncharacterized membrane protein YjjP (DUF1212 family)